MIFSASIEQRNFRGRGQTIGLSGSYSKYSKSIEASFTEPYVFDRNVSMGVDVYRRDYNSFNYYNDDRNDTYTQTTTGFQVRAGVPLTEYMTIVGRYTLNYDKITLDKDLFYTDRLIPGIRQCDPLLAGRYLCEAIGSRTSSIVGVSLLYDTLDSRVRPTRGFSASLSGDYAGLGGSVKYGRLRGNAAQYFPVGGGFVFSLRAEGGLIKSFDNSGNKANGIDDVRLTDRFYLGEPQIRGFDIRGLGPRVIRKPYIDDDGDPATPSVLSPDRKNWTDDAIGGKYYYLGRAELEIPLGSGARELGLRPSIFLDAGAVWGIRRPQLDSTGPDGAFLPTRNSAGQPLFAQVCNGTTTTVPQTGSSTPTLPAECTGENDAITALGTTYAFQEFFYGDSIKPRVSIGIGVNWNSPFGPFRIDFAKVLLKRKGDDTKAFTFNVGTQF
ncbi:MAG: BamA/TamA family outer membrane protein, partial [Novosphingobium sp.]|nr:BamA/TamA family outer membrane protein [Novosphingobium sp.]